CQHHYGTPLTF
nr:immunoglobulin light chain junction region [Mus musculus]NSL97020.1 immunoglobulin light chain junction region [Mus musculus]NSL97065.1 immunoglobulin light chain junction region [Mus musculus]NSL97140.1 immunoglobulin light chain junction region [Mus musculus]NSL97249.1 immunoglobulin light chain junction region [Mus musculus]